MDILEITIKADNLAATEVFYTNVLGFQLVSKGPDFISFLAGQSTLTFIQSTNQNPYYHFAFNIPQNKLDESIEWAKSRFTLIIDADNSIVTDFENWNASAVYFYDNNNNILEFIARYDLSNTTDQAFGVSSILSISEIGIVADAPLELAEKLVDENNIPFYSKGPKTDSFTALGDDNGLLVMVATNRKWYPTDHFAKKHFTKVKISADGSVSELTFND